MFFSITNMKSHMYNILDQMLDFLCQGYTKCLHCFCTNTTRRRTDKTKLERDMLNSWEPI